VLLILPLIGVNSIYGLTTYKDTELSIYGKDSYYRILENQKIDWRAFLAKFVKQYLLKDELFTPSAAATRCLIFKDVDLPKKGKTIEGGLKDLQPCIKSLLLGLQTTCGRVLERKCFYPHRF
jgi:hypothetical protein